jgi:hypothetical protein
MAMCCSIWIYLLDGTEATPLPPIQFCPAHTSISVLTQTVGARFPDPNRSSTCLAESPLQYSFKNGKGPVPYVVGTNPLPIYTGIYS